MGRLWHPEECDPGDSGVFGWCGLNVQDTVQVSLVDSTRVTANQDSFLQVQSKHPWEAHVRQDRSTSVRNADLAR